MKCHRNPEIECNRVWYHFVDIPCVDCEVEEVQEKSPWEWVVYLQDLRHPGWRANMPRTMLTTGLTSEIGSLCDQVTHLDGGGSRILDPEKWNEQKVLHDIVDSWVMLVLTAEKSGFTESDFQREWINVKEELIEG